MGLKWSYFDLFRGAGVQFSANCSRGEMTGVILGVAMKSSSRKHMVNTCTVHPSINHTPEKKSMSKLSINVYELI